MRDAYWVIHKVETEHYIKSIFQDEVKDVVYPIITSVSKLCGYPQFFDPEELESMSLRCIDSQRQLFKAASQINGNQGEATNSDDVEVCGEIKLECKFRQHSHKVRFYQTRLAVSLSVFVARVLRWSANHRCTSGALTFMMTLHYPAPIQYTGIMTILKNRRLRLTSCRI